MNRRVMTVIGAVLLAVGTGACSVQKDYDDNHGIGDAPVGDRDDNPAEVIQMPDGASNVFLKCDGHGHRVYVTSQNASGKEMSIIDDPTCPGGPRG